MTTNEAFSIATEVVEKRFAEIVQRWGFTIKKGKGSSWSSWQIAEIGPYEVVSVLKGIDIISLRRPTQVRHIYPTFSLPEEVEHITKRFVSRALETVVVRLAYKELRKFRGVDNIRKGNSALRFRINPQIFSIQFRVDKRLWSWKIISDSGEPIAIIRRPLYENPLRSLLKAAKYFGLLVL
jgi:hypothetical protein